MTNISVIELYRVDIRSNEHLGRSLGRSARDAGIEQTENLPLIPSWILTWMIGLR